MFSSANEQLKKAGEDTTDENLVQVMFEKIVSCGNDYKSEEVSPDFQDMTLGEFEMLAEDYVSKKTIEAKTLIDMIRSYCTPCVRKEIYDLNKTNLSCDQEIINKLTEYVSKSNELCSNIEHQLFKVDEIEDIKEKGRYILDNIVPLMVELRKYYDDIEKYISHENLIYPTYRELFFDVE